MSDSKISKWIDHLFGISNNDLTVDPSSGMKMRGEDADLCMARIKNNINARNDYISRKYSDSVPRKKSANMYSRS